MIHCVHIPISFPSKSAQCDKNIHSLLDIIFLYFIYLAVGFWFWFWFVCLFFPQVCKNTKKIVQRCCSVEGAV